MKITRSGSAAFHGLSHIDLDEPIIFWSAKDESIHISKLRVEDFTGQSNHDYTVKIPLSDLSLIVQELGNSGLIKSNNVIRGALLPVVGDLQRVVKSCIEWPIEENSSE